MNALESGKELKDQRPLQPRCRAEAGIRKGIERPVAGYIACSVVLAPLESGKELKEPSCKRQLQARDLGWNPERN